MGSRAMAAAATALMLAGCSVFGPTSSGPAPSGVSSKCPKPIVYDEKTLAKIQKALEALPADNILHDVMADYEQERDDLRFCR